MSAPGEVPVLREEIERKTVEAAAWLINAQVKAKLSDAQVSTGFDALWAATAGLVSREAMNLLSDGVDASRGVRPVERAVFHNNKTCKTLVLVWKPDHESVDVAQFTGGVRGPDSSRTFETAAMARHWFKEVAPEGLAAKGFEEI